jgi:hypothetical protein
MRHRQCGEFTLCCKLLPMQSGTRSRLEIAEAAAAIVAHGLATAASFRGMLPNFDKPAGVPCPHQSPHRGCKVYARRPFGCRVWNCRWLTGDGTADLRRPDRSRYVIDVMPDFVTMQPNDGSPSTNIRVIQIWVDPKDRDAWSRDNALLAYLDRQGQQGIAALIRWSAHDGMTVFPPSMSVDGQWHKREGISRKEHRGQELLEGLATSSKVMLG